MPSFFENIDDRALSTIENIWTYSLIHVDGQPITVRKVILALLIFAAGVFVAKQLSRRFTNRLLKKFIDDQNNRFTLETLLFYFLIAVILMISMDVGGIPLTAFTLAGGALAIGLGFGSQNLVKNFISGIILMMERPIKVGDFIETNALFGQVQRIGFRSTRVVAFGNRHIIVPNSAFLEKDVVNWTHQDQYIRAQVSVGVAYGSPTDLVKKLLLQAASEHPKVLKMQSPRVVFRDFGDNSLVFDLYFSIKITSLPDRIYAESDMRFKIDQLFRENQITIAFPQRDVHLDQKTAFKVELVKDLDA